MSQPAATPAQAPKAETIRANDLAARATGKFPDAKLEYATEKRLKLSIPASSATEFATFARDELGFDHISAVSGVDWIAKNEFEVIYFIGSFKPGYGDFVLSISERVPRDNPVVDSLISVWPGAEYQERETHEMFGINFQGSPSQAHLLLPEDWNDLPPLRKDYVSPGR